MSGEGRVYQRGAKWWMDWTDGGGTRHRRSLGLPDGAKESAAKRAFAAYRAEVEAERAVRASGLLERLGLEAAPTSGEVPFSGLAARYLERAELLGKKPLTVYRARLDVRAWLFPYFGHADARTLDAAALDAFQRHLAATPHRHGKLLAPQSVNGIMATLRAVLRHGEELGLLRPAQLPPGLRAKSKEPAWWTLEERDQLLEAAREREPAWWPVFALAFATGLRRGELLALRWSDVHLTPGEERLRVRRTHTHQGEGSPKGGRERVAWLGRLGVEALAQARGAQEVARLDGEDHVFTNKGAPLGVAAIRSALIRLCEAAGLPYRSLHSARHSFCSHLVEKGASPVDVQRLAGHANLTTTQRYFHAADEQLRRAARLLDEPSGTSSVQSKRGGA